jgi:hypothetical protein
VVDQDNDFLDRTTPPLLFVAAFGRSIAAPRLNQGGELL